MTFEDIPFNELGLVGPLGELALKELLSLLVDGGLAGVVWAGSYKSVNRRATGSKAAYTY
jgi:hypothetical protein